MPTAFLDACVLYPPDHRDLLLRLAKAGAFRPLWSPDVQDEWIRNLLQRRGDLTKEQLEHTRRQMNRAFPDACVRDYRRFVEEVRALPDPDDRHVVAAAFVGGAECIVTANVRDFPEEVLGALELEALRPDEFLMLLVELDLRANGVPRTIARGLRALREGLRNPSKTHQELVDHWRRRNLKNFAEFAWTHRQHW